MSQRDKPRQGAVAITLNLFRNGAVGFIDWLGLGLPLQQIIVKAICQLLDFQVV